jgi:hypothetical protein
VQYTSVKGIHFVSFMSMDPQIFFCFHVKHSAQGLNRGGYYNKRIKNCSVIKVQDGVDPQLIMTFCRLVPYFDKFVEHDTREIGGETLKGSSTLGVRHESVCLRFMVRDWYFCAAHVLENVRFFCIQNTFRNT